MYEDLQIIDYPDPRLRKVSAPVSQITPDIRELAMKMLQLMREAKGVGLAAPQVGHNIRLFVMNPTGEAADARIYINPELSDPDGEEAAEEGCLSLPKINADINRSKAMRLRATDLDGNKVDIVETGYVARIWQHEYDHLNGVLITDRMGVADKFKYRKNLREMEEKWAAEHPPEPKSKDKLRRPVRKKK